MEGISDVDKEEVDKLTPELRLIYTLRGHPINEKVTHCRHGHIYDAKNTYTYQDGSRVCRECMNKRRRVAYHKNRIYWNVDKGKEVV